MELAQLQRLVSLGEGLNLEFKKKINIEERIMKEVVAFANTSGGTLLLGVNDDGEITGLKFPDDEAIVFEDALARLCYPPINYSKEVIQVEAKKFVLKYEIEEGADKPYFLLEGPQGIQKSPFVRIEDKSVRASKVLIEIILKHNANYHSSFTYGEHEKKLLNHLETRGSITFREFENLTDLSTEAASKILINLVLSKIISIIPDGDNDRFILKNNTSDTSHSYIYPLN